MFFQQVKSFLTIINTDALIFLGTRLASIILSIVSIVLLCRAVTVQTYFLTDGLGLIYDMLPFGALAYTLAWSVASLILPGCQRKYHPALDMGLDFVGWALSFASGWALLNWALTDSYETEFCIELSMEDCVEAADALSSAEKSGAVLLILTGITHAVMFVRACLAVHARRRRHVPSRNSFMQLQKGSDQRPEVTQLELNATNFVVQREAGKGEANQTLKKPSVDSNDSAV